VVVIPSAIDESPLRGDKEVFVTNPVNTTEDDLQFELLLCLASTIEVVQRLQPSGVSETQRPEVFVTTHLTTNTTKDDLEFELLLCLANTIEAIQALLPNGARGDGRLFERESKNVLNFTRERMQPRRQEPVFSPGSD
jgi:hypothetical protein